MRIHRPAKNFFRLKNLAVKPKVAGNSSSGLEVSITNR